MQLIFSFHFLIYLYLKAFIWFKLLIIIHIGCDLNADCRNIKLKTLQINNKNFY